MMVKRFVFNPFQENTYILYDETNECIIIDAGCSSIEEEKTIVKFILDNQLTPKLSLNTHVHIDHILGNKFIYDRYGLKPHFHLEDLFLYQSSNDVAEMYGLDYSILAPPYSELADGQKISFGKSILKCIHIPGHSPGSICFYNENDKILISGDVLFKESIGRTDLPGGNHQQLLAGISEKLFVLPNDVKVFPGHMESTTINHEKIYNPFF